MSIIITTANGLADVTVAALRNITTLSAVSWGTVRPLVTAY
jgi:hypothetical protein